MKYRYLYYSLSAVILAAGIFGLLKWGINLGVDFTGGAKLEYKLAKPLSESDVSGEFKNNGIELSSIQKSGTDIYIYKFAPLEDGKRDLINRIMSEKEGTEVKELSFENLGPTIGLELVKKTIYALIISTFAILLWIAYQFKSIKFGFSATIATLHDSLVLLGSFALLGHFYGAEVDFLFVTAMLTILSFSVHDTIVVFDRIREKRKKTGGGSSLVSLANEGISETMVRSLNNSFTIIFMLVALILFGGGSVKWFAIALLIGTISGTYSSPFVALSILVSWDEIEEKIKKRLRK
jgi:preprotein translocase subunit SecF